MILQTYILRQIMVAFLFAVGGMLFVAMPGIAVAAVHRLAGVETSAILRFIPLLMLGLVPFILPLGFLLATVVTYGRLAADNEWTAIRMAGIHPLRMCLPPLLLAALCFLATDWLVSVKLPQVKTDQKRYELEAVRETVRNLSPGRTELHIGQFYLQSGYREGNDFIKVFIHIPRSEGAQTILAERVSMRVENDFLLISLRDARLVHGSVDFQGENSEVQLDLGKLIRPPRRGFRSLRYKTTGQIREEMALEDAEPKRKRLMAFEVHHRRALSFTYFMFLALGIPTGLLLRKGTQLGALSAAVAYALLYYLLSFRLGKELASSDILQPVFCAWLVVSAGSALGLFMLWRALRR